MDDLVGQGQLLEQAVEVADAGVDVDGLDRIAAGDVDAVEVLRQPHEVAEVRHVADPSAAVEVHGVGRRGDVDEGHVAPADRHPSLGIAGGDVELAGGLGHLLQHEAAIHAHGDAVDGAAGGAQVVARLVVEEVDADLLEDAHRRVVDRGDAFGRQRLGRPVGVDRDAPWHLGDRSGRGAAPVAAAPRPAFGHRPASSCRRQWSRGGGVLVRERRSPRRFRRADVGSGQPVPVSRRGLRRRRRGSGRGRRPSATPRCRAPGPCPASSPSRRGGPPAPGGR